MNLDKTSVIDDIIQEIQSNCIDFDWKLTNEDLISILGVRKEDYYRTLYSIKNKSRYNFTTTGFYRGDAESLFEIIKSFLKIENFEEQFVKAGVHTSPKLLLSLNHRLIDFIQELLDKHKIDLDLLLLLCSSTLAFDDAFDSYFDSKFDIDLIIRRTVDNFINEKEIDSSFGIEDYLIKYLKEQLTKNRISFYKITQFQRDKYYYEVFGSYRPKKIEPLSPEKLALLKFFGLKQTSGKKELKFRYKELLKKYHPDVNKDGLEKTKVIIQNYKKLVSLMEG